MEGSLGSVRFALQASPVTEPVGQASVSSAGDHEHAGFLMPWPGVERGSGDQGAPWIDSRVMGCTL